MVKKPVKRNVPVTNDEENDIPVTKSAKKAKAPTKKAPKKMAVQVRDGSRDGFCELVFPDKPDASVLTELKAAGFRWSPFNKVWYGLVERLPERYSA